MSNVESLEEYKRLKKLGLTVPAIRGLLAIIEFMNDELEEMNRRLDLIEEVVHDVSTSD